MSKAPATYSFFIDRGGTFTDVIMSPPEGPLVARKYLSENPERYKDASVAAILDLLAERGASLGDVGDIRMGTTVATNALLEHAGTPVCLAITAGFEDALAIGYQSRPQLFAQHIVKPTPLYERIITINERLDAEGRIVHALDLDAAKAALTSAFTDGFRSLAIVLMHAYLNPDHEQILAQLAFDIGFTQVSISSDMSRLMRLIPRGDTAVVDAYLSPVLRHYVAQIDTALGVAAQKLLFMQSNGGLVAASTFAGKDAILSGPAGGVVALSALSKAFDMPVIGFDMGGTSTDVARFADGFERTDTAEIAGVRLSSQMLKIHTVAAGGGSICRFDGARLRVGPQSAGADPGPASYRRGGPLTVTDCALIVGKIQPSLFPEIFGPTGDQPIDWDAAFTAISQVADDIYQATGIRHAIPKLAEGFLEIAVQTMAQAIKTISVEKGHDLKTHALVAFGGAGGQHAVRIAEALGIQTVLIHPLAGVMSAYGLGLADVRALKVMSVNRPIDEDVNAIIDTTKIAAQQALEAQGVSTSDIGLDVRLMVKISGADTALAIWPDTVTNMTARFHELHRRAFGYQELGRPLEIERIEVEAVANRQQIFSKPIAKADVAQSIGSLPLFLDGETSECPVYRRTDLGAGVVLHGPALIQDELSTHCLEAGWRASVGDEGTLVITQGESMAYKHALATSLDPITLELFNNRFMAIAEDMGARLQATAHSVNIKERLDFSCALFSAKGELIANAPHMPVHLGSMGACVKHIMDVCSTMEDGDVFMHNDPYSGGTHLPDITVIAPVFIAGTKPPAFYVAARGHHADVGGITPGSMPPFSIDIAEEGKRFDRVRIVRKGLFDEAQVTDILSQEPWPARRIAQNIADLKAQVAACNAGINGLIDLCHTYGHKVVSAYVDHVLDNGEFCVRQAIRKLKTGQADVLFDDGARVRVCIDIDPDEGSATLDFTGTSAQQNNNLNAPLAICRAASLYVFRTLINEDIPLNEGCLRPLTLIVPEGSLLNPNYPAAVAGGNVETSQVVVDALYQALGSMAGAQGTMNNFTFGDDAVQYYETICGGSGAGDGFHGADAVQTHMTNSRLTDPEILEKRFPVRLKAFGIRHGSGGAGQYHGGDGTVRKMCFLKPMTASILSNRRLVAPSGLLGGQDGAVGKNYVCRADGTLISLKGADSFAMDVGDQFIIETPGGGGFGKEEDQQC